MRKYSIISGFLVVLCATNVHAIIKCNRLCDCKNGGTTQPDGNCLCPNGYYGYDCGLNLTPTSGNRLCQGGSSLCQGGMDTICYNDNRCYCDGFHFGEKCNYKKEKVTCTQDSMTIEVAVTHDELTLEKYLLPDVQCEFTERPEKVEDWYVFKKTINLNERSPECMSAITVTQYGDTKSYKATWRGRRVRGYNTENDWSTDFTCNFTAKGTPQVRDATERLNPLEFHIMDMTGQPVNAIKSSEAFDLVFSLKDTTAYKDLDIDSLTIYSQKDHKIVMPIMENGEITPVVKIAKGLRTFQPIKFLFTPPPDENGQKQPMRPAVRVEINPNKNYPNQIYIDYSVKPCQHKGCTPTPMYPNQENFGQFMGNSPNPNPFANPQNSQSPNPFGQGFSNQGNPGANQRFNQGPQNANFQGPNQPRFPGASGPQPFPGQTQQQNPQGGFQPGQQTPNFFGQNNFNQNPNPGRAQPNNNFSPGPSPTSFPQQQGSQGPMGQQPPNFNQNRGTFPGQGQFPNNQQGQAPRNFQNPNQGPGFQGGPGFNPNQQGPNRNPQFPNNPNPGFPNNQAGQPPQNQQRNFGQAQNQFGGGPNPGQFGGPNQRRPPNQGQPNQGLPNQGPSNQLQPNMGQSNPFGGPSNPGMPNQQRAPMNQPRPNQFGGNQGQPNQFGGPPGQTNQFPGQANQFPGQTNQFPGQQAQGQQGQFGQSNPPESPFGGQPDLGPGFSGGPNAPFGQGGSSPSFAPLAQDPSVPFKK